MAKQSFGNLAFADVLNKLYPEYGNTEDLNAEFLNIIQKTNAGFYDVLNRLGALNTRLSGVPTEINVPVGEAGYLLIGQGDEIPTVFKEVTGIIDIAADGEVSIDTDSFDVNTQTAGDISRALDTKYDNSTYMRYVTVCFSKSSTAGQGSVDFWVDTAGGDLTSPSEVGTVKKMFSAVTPGTDVQNASLMCSVLVPPLASYKVVDNSDGGVTLTLDAWSEVDYG
jgi:hypothetical protein